MEGLSVTIPIARNCPLDGLVLYEPVDANLLDKCTHSDLLKVNYTDTKWFSCEKQQLENIYGRQYYDNCRYELRMLPTTSSSG